MKPKGLLLTLIIILLLAAAYFVFVIMSTGTVNQTVTANKNVAATLPGGATVYDSKAAGIPDNFDSDTMNLAYIKAIDTTDAGTIITIDPVAIIDCRTLQNTNVTLPTLCPTDPNTADISAAYPIDNTDTTTQTYTLAKKAGPYFIATITNTTTDSVPGWVWLNLVTLHQLLAGTFDLQSATGLYDADLYTTPNLFHIIRDENTVTKVIEKYRQ